MECVFCIEKLTIFADARKLPCGHVACMSCLSQQAKASRNIQCPTCRLEFKTFDVSSLDSGNPASIIHKQCGVCQDKMADVFCVTCQMALCSAHQEEDQDKADRSGVLAHYQVKMKQFMKSKEVYERHNCRVHLDRLTSHACVRCLQVFCSSCNPHAKCPEADKEHKLSLLSDSVKVVKNQIAELQAALADKVAMLQSLEKDVAREIGLIQEEEDRLIAEVNRTVKEQVDQITYEGECLKAEIRKYTGDFKVQAEALTVQLETASTQAKQGINDLENVTKVSVDGLLIERFSAARKDIKEITCRNYAMIWTPSKYLVSTGRFRSLEIRLEELSPCSMEHIHTVRAGDDRYYSVRWISADLMVTGSSNGIEMWDSKLQLICYIRVGQCYDVVPYRDQLVVLHKSRGSTKTIKLFSQTLEEIRDIVELPTKSTQLSQLAAADERIVASEPDRKCVYLYTFNGELLHTIHLSGMANPRGVCITSDGNLVVTDIAAVKDSVRKYQLRGDYSLMWESDKLLRPWGIVEHNTGVLFVSRNDTNNSLYQLSPEGRLLNELTCDPLNKTKETLGISVAGDSLAVACRGKGLKLFKFKYIQ